MLFFWIIAALPFAFADSSALFDDIQMDSGADAPSGGHSNTKSSPDRQEELDRIHKSGHVSIRRFSGFEFCPQLNGAFFDENAELDAELITLRVSELLPDLKLPENVVKHSGRGLRNRIKRFFKRIFRFFRRHKKGEKPETAMHVYDIAEFLPTIIDALAQDLYFRDISEYRLHRLGDEQTMKPYEPMASSAKDFSCYMTAVGYNAWMKISLHGPLLRYVNPKSYFGGKIGFADFDVDDVNWELMRRHERPDITTRKPYSKPLRQDRCAKLAYFLMVHNNFENVQQVLQDIVDEHSIVLIHVDEKNPDLKAQIQEYLVAENYEENKVRVMKESFNGVWGHITLVLAQTAGMFEMLDMDPDWEYWINISGNDAMLQTNLNIYEKLHVEGESDWIEYHYSPEVLLRMKGLPGLLTKDRRMGVATVNVPDSHIIKFLPKFFAKSTRKLWFPYEDWSLRKQQQWMILHRSTVNTMRHSPTAANLLAFMEFSTVPDEGYYITLLMNAVSRDPRDNKRSKIRVISDMKRFIDFPVGLHPNMITYEYRGRLQEAVRHGKIITRKVDLSKEKDLMRWIRYNKLNDSW